MLHNGTYDTILCHAVSELKAELAFKYIFYLQKFQGRKNCNRGSTQFQAIILGKNISKKGSMTRLGKGH